MQTTKPVIDAGPGFYIPGDVVMLVSGGPDMTVVDMCEGCGDVEVAFFLFDSEGGCEFVRDIFPSICLELAK